MGKSANSTTDPRSSARHATWEADASPSKYRSTQSRQPASQASPHGSNRFFVVIGAAAATAAVFGAWVGFAAHPDPGTLQFEAAKLVVGATAVALLASLVALFVELMKKRDLDRQARIERDAESYRALLHYEADMLRDLLQRLDASYRAVKVIKRRLAARFGNDLTGTIPRAELYEVLDGMSSGPQLDLEQLTKDIDVLAELGFTDLTTSGGVATARQSVRDDVAAMEDYLSKMWRQFERLHPVLDDPFVFAPGLKISRLAAFVNSHSAPRPETSALVSKLGRDLKDSADNDDLKPQQRYDLIYFRPAFARPYHDARQQIGVALGRRLLHTEAGATTARRG